MPTPPTDVAGLRPLALPADQPPILLVLIHTEEEFDWTEPFSREATATTAIPALDGVQRRLELAGIRPTYAVDWPVVQREDFAARFGTWSETGAAEIGAHLHPWVNPPYEEPVDTRHSYAGNLEPRLERAKLAHLTDAIEQRIGTRPRTYLAGRHGLGAHTPRTLVELGYRVDASVMPTYDYRADDGPDFRHHPVAPFRWPGLDELMAVPVTAGFHGALRRTDARLHGWLASGWRRRLRLAGLASRSGLLSRVRLTPEGFDLEHLEALTVALHAEGLRVFTLSVHSTSFVPGHTMYVPSTQELVRLHDRSERFIDWFRTRFDAVCMTHQELADRLLPVRREEPPGARAERPSAVQSVDAD